MELLRSAPIGVVSFGPGASLAAWMLAGLGADVRHRTFANNADLDCAAFIDGAEPASGSDPFGDLEAPVIVTDAPFTSANRAALERISRAARVVWITPWGCDGPWAERPASDLVLHAAGGWMSATGDPDREPLGPPGPQASYLAGLFAAVEAAAAFALPGGARPGITDVSAAEAVLATTIYDAVAFQYFGRVRPRTGARYAPTQPTIVTLPCRDGFVGIHATLHRQWVLLAEAMGHPELVRDPRFLTHGDRAEHLAELDAYLLPWLQAHGRWELFERLQALGIPAAPTPDAAEVLSLPHLEVRRAWRDLRLPDGRSVRVPVLPIRETFVSPAVAAAHDGREGPWRQGALRVVDLSMGWAGPLAGHILACFGADVIKVESHRRYDWWRGGTPGADPELQLHERSHVFNGVNRGKRGIALDLATPVGREALLRLLRGADVLVENFRPGTLERLGLSPERLLAENPGLVVLRHSGFGSTGPWARYFAFGNTIESLSGLAAATGYPGGPPRMMSNAYGDPVGGLTATVGLLAALAARQRDGRGRCIEVAQLEAMLPLVTPVLLEYQLSGRVPPRRGNARPGSVLAGVFPCRGEDRWLAVEARNHFEAARLASVLGTAETPTPAEVAAWCKVRDRHEAAATLAAAGVPAAPVYDEADTLAEEPFASRGFWSGEERAVVGFHLYPLLPLRRDGKRFHPGRPAPLLGEHTAEVLRSLGYDERAVESFFQEGVSGSVPVPP
ncbi:Succinyl-CoA:(R)-benzylsuccinate CoA-transferase subunit BbsF [bacterium HR29]|nr:Succinyl-CoA:(R)-benzylsuccinate CoA-transferase subunit BbsF [bacterium HR29]